jgi:RNA polymerase sigma factor (sigma-70 family)
MTPIVSATILRTQSDERLLTLTRQGYERAFEAIVERYRRPMMRYCRRYLPETRAEDAVQQAFISAWSALRDGTEVGDLRAWLYRITRNAAIDAAKRAGYDYGQLSEALRLMPAPEAELERRAVMRETLTGVAALPTNQREALLRTVVEGHSRADIARDMRISEGAVRQLVHRARMALRSAATALTPTPVIGWATSFGGGDAPIGARIAELAAGGGAAGGAGVLVKTGTAIVVAGVFAVEAGTRLDHPSSAAGDSGAGHRAKAARLAGASPADPADRRATRRRPARGAWARVPTARRPRPAQTAAEGSRDEGSRRSGRGSPTVSPTLGSVNGSGDEDEVESPSGPGGGHDSRDRQADNSGPGSQTSDDDGDGGDDNGSDSEGSDGDGDQSGSDSGGDDSDNGDSNGDRSDSGGDRSGSDGDGGGSGKQGSGR